MDRFDCTCNHTGRDINVQKVVIFAHFFIHIKLSVFNLGQCVYGLCQLDLFSYKVPFLFSFLSNK
jgi:hypothetical protein